jgi:aspartyl-tRNA synthetase
MPRTLSSQTPEHIGETITVSGWVHAKRDHSKVLFIDLRDRTGLLQVVTGTFNPESFATLKDVSAEDVIEITGAVAARPEKLINPNIASGTVELQAISAKILNKSAVPPFEISGDTKDVDEELRLKHRYLDLRTERMTKNVRMRSEVYRFIRHFLDNEGFTEIDTPLLTASTPEGARDFVVPTRNPGLFYALPQSPQQYKQLLMVAGFERYYQIAHMMRDEDSRGDRQPEFTQLDMELSFTPQEEILQLNERLFTELVEELYPEKYISQKPWPRLTYAESMEKYGNDKPDLRKDKNDPNELAFAWVLDFPLFEWNEKENRIEPMHHMFTMPKEEHLPLLESDPLKVIGQLYDMVCNGYETASGSIRIVNQDIQRKIFSLIGMSDDEAKRKFGHMLEAFSFGAPPHGGIAPGIDRLMMILQEEPNIREVIPFAKTGEGRDPMMNAPAPLSDAQLKELSLQVKPS